MGNNFLRKSISICILSVMVFSMAACGNSGSEASHESASKGSETASESSVRVGCVVKFEHEFYTSLMEGAEAACKELGYEFSGMAPQSATDIEGQVTIVEDMATDGVDVLLVAPNQETTLYNAMDSAVDDGAMVIAVDTDLTEYENKTAFVGTDNYNALYEAGQTLASCLDGEKNVIILRGALGDATHENRAAGATDGLKDAGCNILECYAVDGTTAEGASAAIEDFITVYGSDIDAVLCCGDDMASGVITAVAQAGMADDILVSGYDGLDIGIKNVANGSQVFDMSQDPYQMGYKAVYTANAVLNGEDYEENVDTGVQLITEENVADFQ